MRDPVAVHNLFQVLSLGLPPAQVARCSVSDYFQRRQAALFHQCVKGAI